MNWDLLDDPQLLLDGFRELLFGYSSLIVAGLAGIALVLQAVAITRAHRRIRLLGAEFARVQLQLLGIERLQYEADEKAQRDSVRLAQLERAQQRVSAGFGKPDAQLAFAMIRAGADSRALVDCGLSHGESHLVKAIHSLPDEKRREIEPCVISSGHEH